VLRTCAGLFRPQTERIVVAGETWADSASRLHSPTRQRSIGMVSQRPHLFPNMSVRENVRFGADGANDLVEELMRRFRCAEYAERRPAGLSGGEQQRVALARALARHPKLLLLDEPFVGLDEALRDDILDDFNAWLATSETFALAATHNVAEVFGLRAEVVRIQAGRVVEQGPAEKVLATEKARLLARLTSAPARARE
jgi:molybdate transport system ATP-binding protein